MQITLFLDKYVPNTTSCCYRWKELKPGTMD